MSTHFPSPADATFDRPVSILLSCHDKVRHFAGLMLKLEAHLAGQRQRQQPGGPATASPDARHAAGLVRRYFEVAAPLHHQDEEDDVFPALLALEDTALSARIHALTAAHREFERLWPPISAWLGRVAQGSVEAAPAGMPLYAQAHPAHADQEDAEVYPAMDRLDAATLARIGERMRRRRHGPGDTLPASSTAQE